MSFRDLTTEDQAIVARLGTGNARHILNTMRRDERVDARVMNDRVRYYDTHNFRAGIHENACICRLCEPKLHFDRIFRRQSESDSAGEKR